MLAQTASSVCLSVMSECLNVCLSVGVFVCMCRAVASGARITHATCDTRALEYLTRILRFGRANNRTTLNGWHSLEENTAEFGECTVPGLRAHAPIVTHSRLALVCTWNLILLPNKQIQIFRHRPTDRKRRMYPHICGVLIHCSRVHTITRTLLSARAR